MKSSTSGAPGKRNADDLFVRFFRWILYRKDLTSAEKLVLVFYANQEAVEAAHDGHRPRTYSEVAKRLSLSMGKVRQAVTKLEGLGLLHRTEEGRLRRIKVNVPEGAVAGFVKMPWWEKLLGGRWPSVSPERSANARVLITYLQGFRDAMVDRYGREGAVIRKAIPTIGEELGLGRAAVRLAMETLESQWLITRQYRENGTWLVFVHTLPALFITSTDVDRKVNELCKHGHEVFDTMPDGLVHHCRPPCSCGRYHRGERGPSLSLEDDRAARCVVKGVTPEGRREIALAALRDLHSAWAEECRGMALEYLREAASKERPGQGMENGGALSLLTPSSPTRRPKRPGKGPPQRYDFDRSRYDSAPKVPTI